MTREQKLERALEEILRIRNDPRFGSIERLYAIEQEAKLALDIPREKAE